MKNNTESTNIDFLRWKHGTHEKLLEKLKPLVNWNDLSHYALGNKQISTWLAKKIESQLFLPDGWISRDNISLTTLTKDDYALVSAILSSRTEVKLAIFNLLKAIQAETPPSVQSVSTKPEDKKPDSI